MKITNKMDGDIFARKLALEASAQNENHIILAQDTVDLKNEAAQSAQSYWMMGWTWDEIESILEDSEYPKNVITYAIKETKEYARKILNEGPFKVLNVGQSVKLINGSIGILEEKFADSIAVNIKGMGKVQIKANQLDLTATEKLREAYYLHMKAANMLYKLSTDQLEHVSVESQVVEPELKSVDTALSTMESIRQNTDEVKREATQIHNNWEANIQKWEPQSQEEKSFAQYMHITLTGEKQLDSEIKDLFHTRLYNALASLDDSIRKGAVVDKNIIDFLDNNFPVIAEDIEGHLYGIKQRNIAAREYIQQFTKFGKNDADWKKTAVQWATSSWATTKEFMNTWETSLVPQIEKGIQTIATFLNEEDTRQKTETIQAAVRTSLV